MSEETEVRVPDIGDFSEVEVIEVLVRPGDAIELEQSLITVESDKASMEIPSPLAGVVGEVLVSVGDKVSMGSPVLRMSSKTSPPAPRPGPGAAQPEPDRPAASTVSRDADRPAATVPMAAPAEARDGGSGGALTVEVPDIGDFADVEVIEILVRPGDRVDAEQSLITVESDKASMEIPAPEAGVVEAVIVAIGDKVSKGSPIVRLEASVGGSGPVPAATVPVPAASTPAASTPPATPGATADAQAARAHPVPAEMHGDGHVVKAHASPSVRKFARELGVDLGRVRGSGPKQRIVHEDVRAFVKGVMLGATQPAASAAPAPASEGTALGLIPWPKVDFTKFGPTEPKSISRIRRISAANLHRNWVMIPHVTNHDDADVTELEDFRVRLNKENEKRGVKVTMLAFLVKACVAALKEFPEFNASLDGENLILKHYYHIGVAADTPNGLVVPVVRDADKKGVIEIAAEMSTLAKKARDGKLSPSDMQGGSFSISSLGGIGGTYFTPIINAPEVAILGVCRSSLRPVWDGEKFAPRLVLPMSLSWDHRVIDGAAAARFNAYLGQLLADFRRVLL